MRCCKGVVEEVSFYKPCKDCIFYIKSTVVWMLTCGTNSRFIDYFVHCIYKNGLLTGQVL